MNKTAKEWQIHRDSLPVGSPEWHAAHRAGVEAEKLESRPRFVSQRRHVHPVDNSYSRVVLGREPGQGWF